MKTHQGNQKSNLTENFRSLSSQVLEYASGNLPWLDFLEEISNKLLDFSGSDTILLWLPKGNKKNKYKEIKCSRNSFSFRIVSKLTEKNKSYSKLDSVSWIFYENLLNGNLDPNSHWVTESGSVWINNIENLYKGNLNNQSKIEYLFNIDKKKFKSIGIIPVNIGCIKIGVFQIMSQKVNFFSDEEISYYEEFAQTLGLVIINQRAQTALRERVKELTCLYGISQSVDRHGTSLDHIIADTVNLLPPAWQYPQITQAKIIFDDNIYTSPWLKKGLYSQKANIVVKGKKRGEVEVTYTKKKYTLDEGPFLKEERHLINKVAKELSLIIEQKQFELERKKLEEQLRHADRLATVGQLTAGVAHELNEPLGNILGFAQLVKKTPGLPKQTVADIENIITTSFYIREIIKKLMLFTRQTPSKKVSVDINHIVNDSLYFLESRCLKEGIDVVRELSPDIPEINADPSQLNQIIVNLVVNAVQAMQNGGTLTIQTYANRDHVSLVVTDTGIGMSQNLIKKIFMPFFSTKDVGEGTGLGLAVVHGIVTSHSGTIKVDSKTGMGSRFEIRLPTSPKF